MTMPHKNKASNLDYKLTAESRRRSIPNLKSIYELMRRPGIISLAGGTPNSSIFPFDALSSVSLSPPFNNGVAESKLTSKNSMKVKIFENYDSEDQDGGDIELSTALQYGAAIGDDRLRDFLKTHANRVHDIGFSDWDLIISIGNTYAWDTVLRTFCETTDAILFEEFTFPSALENAQTRGCDCISVKLDEFGLIPEDLERKAKHYRPKLLYTIPTGQNPTGSVLSAKRRKLVMEIARKYDFLVVEDEPYYYLQMSQDLEQASTPRRGEFLKSLVPSMLHYDSDGRVIRLDSFSKIMAPGIRMGWIIAQSRFTDAIRKTMECSSSKPSGFAQSLVYGVLKRWGQDGLIDWLIGLRQEYTERRNICCGTLINRLDSATNFHLTVPQAGMFFWIALIVNSEDSLKDVEEDFFYKMADEHNVLLVPGHWCKVSKETSKSPAIYFRGTFSSESKSNVEEGAKRLAAAINIFFKERSQKSITRENYVLVD